METILLVEDDPLIAESLQKMMAAHGLQILWSENQAAARRVMRTRNFSLVLCDYQLPDGTGHELLTWSQSLPYVPAFLLMSAYGSISRAVEAVRAGALDFLEKPLDPIQVVQTVKSILDAKAPRPVYDNHADPENPGIVFHPGSPLEEALELARLVATKTCGVFIQGESGTGKEALARYVHNAGPRRPRPFVAVNCAAIAPGLIESELFGHRKGAFTGATEDSPGKIPQAEGGTLFLDEIGDMPLALQTKLLRVLQEKAVLPVGGREEREVDFRLVCATHKDLRAEVEGGRFREDLYFRINVMEIRMPPLRERPGDIPSLVRHFLKESMRPEDVEREVSGLPRALLEHPFPGNIRELKNLVERYGILREMGRSWEEILSFQPRSTPVTPTQPIHAYSAETGMLRKTSGAGIHTERVRNSFLSDDDVLKALEICGFHRGKASALLGVSRRALQYRLAKMDGRTR